MVGHLITAPVPCLIGTRSGLTNLGCRSMLHTYDRL